MGCQTGDWSSIPASYSIWRFRRWDARVRVAAWRRSAILTGVGKLFEQLPNVCVIFSSGTVVPRWQWQLSKAPLDTKNFTHSFQPAVLRQADKTAETVTKSFVHYNEDHWFSCQQGSTRLLLQICHRHLCWCITPLLGVPYLTSIQATDVSPAHTSRRLHLVFWIWE